MITQAPKWLNSASTHEGPRIADTKFGPVVIDGTPGSVTMCRAPITEIPPEMAAPDFKEIQAAVKEEVVKQKLTLKELSAVRCLFPVWDKSAKEGDVVRDDLSLKVVGKDGKLSDAKVCAEIKR
jgi:hypothetical protein